MRRRFRGPGLRRAPGSPAIGTGPNGRDQGGVVPLGASISGEPDAITVATGANLTVGINRSVPGWPAGSGYTHYKWRTNGGAWSVEIPIQTPLSLSGLASGIRRVEIKGRRDSGLFQDDPLFAPDAVVTSSRTWVVTNNLPGRVVINEILATNAGALMHEGETPDAIELFNPGSSPVAWPAKGSRMIR